MTKTFARIFAALMLVVLATPAWAQSDPFKFDSLATTNSTEVVSGQALLKVLVLINTTTTLYYLKLYDTAAAPTCNTATVKFKVPVPFGASNAGGGAAVPIPQDGLRFTNGLGFCLTGGVADNDNTAAATGVVISMGVKQ
jgi:hypothetical protein